MSTKSKKNYYEVLKVSPLASPTAIKKAYRKLARLHHPDKNKDNPQADEIFKQINQAYQILSDPFKRKAFDQQIKKEKELAEKNKQGFSHMYDSFQAYPAYQGQTEHVPSSGGTAPPHASPPFTTDIAGDSPHPIRDTKMGHLNQKSFSLNNLKDRVAKALNPDVISAKLPITLEEAVLGCQKALSLNVRQKGPAKKKVFMVSVPPGAKEGQVIKVTSVLQVSLVYESHPLFQADGDHITMNLPVPWTKAILGGEVRVPTLRGEVSFQLPAGTHGGHVIQLKGQGFPLPHSKQRGAMLVTIVIDIPSDFSEQEKEWITKIHNRKALCPKVAEFEIKAKLLLKKRRHT